MGLQQIIADFFGNRRTAWLTSNDDRLAMCFEPIFGKPYIRRFTDTFATFKGDETTFESCIGLWRTHFVPSEVGVFSVFCVDTGAGDDR